MESCHSSPAVMDPSLPHPVGPHVSQSHDQAPTSQPRNICICSICKAIPFRNLPSEDEPGYPHQPSLQALRASAKGCHLCRLILFAVDENKDLINNDHRGIPCNNGAWKQFDPGRTVAPGRTRFEVTVLGAYLPGSNKISGRWPGAVDPPSTGPDKPGYPFRDDTAVRPWLFGSWWRYDDSGPADLLVGLGVRVGQTGLLGDGEGNKTFVQTDQGKVEDHVTFRGTHLRLRVRDGWPGPIVNEECTHRTCRLAHGGLDSRQAASDGLGVSYRV